MTPHFQLATITDISEILHMMQDFNQIDSYPFDAKLSERNLEHFISDDYLGRIWTIWVDSKLAGYVVLCFGFSFEYGGRDAFLDEMYIKLELRGQGIGKLVLRFLESQCRSLGVRAIHLEVEQTNAVGNHLYLEAGYAGNNRRLLSKRID